MTTSSKTKRPDMYRFHNGEKSPLPFEAAEYEARLEELRERMEAAGATAAVFTSMPYYTTVGCLRVPEGDLGADSYR